METITLTYGGLTRSELSETLTNNGIHLNHYAELILTHPDLQLSQQEHTVELVTLTLTELGLDKGANLLEVFATAKNLGYALCELEIALYLPLNYKNLTNSYGLRSTHRAPADSITIASPLLNEDLEFPKGLYIRRIEGLDWLRGYRCDDEHRFAKTDTFLFKQKS